MGTLKDRLIEEDDRGWRSLSQKLVCDECIDDKYLRDFIQENGQTGRCEYCENEDVDQDEYEVQCLPFDDLMNVVGEAINWAYCCADDEDIPYGSHEYEGMFEDSTFSSYELITEVLGIASRDRVVRDMVRALPDHQWCRKNYWSLTLAEALHSGWEDFVHRVKYEVRYLFTLPEPGPREPPHVQALPPESGLPLDVSLEDDIPYDRQNGIPVHEMLDAVGCIVRVTGLVRDLPGGTTLYRARVHGKEEEPLSRPADFGPPPPELTRPSRMSPKGIVMFYGALDRETALVETFEPARDGAKKNVCVARFKTLLPLRVLDLTNLPRVPGMFEPSRRDQIDQIAFLHGFAGDLVKPIGRDGRECIDYVPTQIVTEYFRHRFLLKGGQQIAGILYRSSRRRDGTACVLFIDRFACGVPETHSWHRGEQVLQLDDSAIEILDGAAANSWYPK